MPYIGLGAYAGSWTGSWGRQPDFGTGFWYAGSGVVQSTVDASVKGSACGELQNPGR